MRRKRVGFAVKSGWFETRQGWRQKRGNLFQVNSGECFQVQVGWRRWSRRGEGRQACSRMRLGQSTLPENFQLHFLRKFYDFVGLKVETTMFCLDNLHFIKRGRGCLDHCVGAMVAEPGSGERCLVKSSYKQII